MWTFHFADLRVLNLTLEYSNARLNLFWQSVNYPQMWDRQYFLSHFHQPVKKEIFQHHPHNVIWYIHICPNGKSRISQTEATSAIITISILRNAVLLSSQSTPLPGIAHLDTTMISGQFAGSGFSRMGRKSSDSDPEGLNITRSGSLVKQLGFV